MKTEGNLRPEPFEINLLPKNTAEVVFSENVSEIPDETGLRYEYDLHIVNVKNRPDLRADIEANYDRWIELARAGMAGTSMSPPKADSESGDKALRDRVKTLESCMGFLLDGHALSGTIKEFNKTARDSKKILNQDPPEG